MDLQYTDLYALIEKLILSQSKSLELKTEEIAAHAAKKVIEEMTPQLEKQLECSAKAIVANARDRLVLEITGESYEDQNSRKQIRNGIQWAIKSANKATTVTNAALIALTSTLISSIVAFFITKKF